MPKRRRSSTNKEFSSLVSLLSPKLIVSSCRHSPLPNFDWADPSDVWEYMQKKDKLYTRNSLLLHRHPGLEASMRAILLDWLAEVCEVYQLHKETYYLAIDYIDRYLSVKENVPKQSLQLIGITCLFIAAKTEEIYPPKLAEFAFVTDGACSEKEIILKELVILKALNWQLYPMTITNWLNVYMQLYSIYEKENNYDTNDISNRKRRKIHCNNDSKKDTEDFLIPVYSTYFFAQVAHLIDLCIFDIESLRFPYSIIAASALYHFTNEEVISHCTAFTLNEIKECILWLTPFAMAIQEDGFDKPKLQRKDDDLEATFSLQCHTADLSLLEKAQKKQAEFDAANFIKSDDYSNSDEENEPVNDTNNNNNNNVTCKNKDNEKLNTNTTAGATANGPPSSPLPSSSILTPPRSHSKAIY